MVHKVICVKIVGKFQDYAIR